MRKALIRTTYTKEADGSFFRVRTDRTTELEALPAWSLAGRRELSNSHRVPARAAIVLCRGHRARVQRDERSTSRE